MEFLSPYISYQAGWQTNILLFFQSLRSDPLNVIFFGITSTGSEFFYIALICIIFWCINKRIGYYAGFSLVTANILNAGLKNTFQVPRPIGHNGITCVDKPFNAFPGGFSFPSGHSMGTGSFWYSIVTGFKQRWITILGISLMILVPVSRLYLGVHTPVDVITGLTLGILTAWIMGKIFSVAEKKKTYIMLITVLPFAVWCFFMNDPEYWKGLGTLLGLSAGFMIESEVIKFAMPKKIRTAVLRIITGIAILLAIKTGLKLMLPESLLSDAFRYCCIGLWVTSGAPAAFKALKI